MPIKASCPNCAKRYRVPHASKEWRCKVCEEVLVLGEFEEVSSATQVCLKCGFENAASAHFCEECGEPFAANDESAEKRKKSEKTAVNADMKAAIVSMRRFQNFLRVLLILRTIPLIQTIGTVINAQPSSSTGLDLALVELAVIGFDVGLLVLVIYQLPRRPFPAALTLACVSTLYFAIILLSELSGDGEFALAVFLYAIWPFVYWVVTAKAAALTRLAKENPDHSIAKRMRGELGKSGTSSRRRVASDSKPPYIALGVIASVVIGVVVVGLLNRPNDVEPELDRILSAWNEKDFDTLSEYVKSSSRKKWTKSLSNVSVKYGWGEDWPEARAYKVAVAEKSVYVDLETEAGVVPFRLKWSDDNGWRLSSMSFADVKDWKE